MFVNNCVTLFTLFITFKQNLAAAASDEGLVENADLDNDIQNEDGNASSDEEDGTGEDADNNNSNAAGLFPDETHIESPNCEGQHENRFQRSFRLAWERIDSLEGQTVCVGKGTDEIEWKVVKEVTENIISPDGLCGLKPEYNRTKMSSADLFLLLWPGDIWEQRERMNKVVREVINIERKRRFLRPTKEVSERELLTFLSLVLASTQYNVRGRDLWDKGSLANRNKFTSAPNFGLWMSYSHFCEVKKLVPIMMWDKNGHSDSDDWWRHRGFIDGFNEKRNEILVASRIFVLDETMSALCPR